MKNFWQKLWEILKAVFLHKRMKSLYWQMGALLTASLGAVLTDVLPQFGVKEFLILLIGSALAQITKSLNSKAQ
jgi:4-hydroxybenzoate polyprenyltransferase